MDSILDQMSEVPEIQHWDAGFVFDNLERFQFCDLSPLSWELLGFLWFTGPNLDELFRLAPNIIARIFGGRVVNPEFSKSIQKKSYPKGRIFPYCRALDMQVLSPPLKWSKELDELLCICRKGQLGELEKHLSRETALTDKRRYNLGLWNYDIEKTALVFKNTMDELLREGGRMVPRGLAIVPSERQVLQVDFDPGKGIPYSHSHRSPEGGGSTPKTSPESSFSSQESPGGPENPNTSPSPEVLNLSDAVNNMTLTDEKPATAQLEVKPVPADPASPSLLVPTVPSSALPPPIPVVESGRTQDYPPVKDKDAKHESSGNTPNIMDLMKEQILPEIKKLIRSEFVPVHRTMNDLETSIPKQLSEIQQDLDENHKAYSDGMSRYATALARCVDPFDDLPGHAELRLRIIRLKEYFTCLKFTTPTKMTLVLMESTQPRLDFSSMKDEEFIDKATSRWNTEVILDSQETNLFDHEVVTLPRVSATDAIKKTLNEAIKTNPLIIKLNENIVSAGRIVGEALKKIPSSRVPNTAGGYAVIPPEPVEGEDDLLRGSDFVNRPTPSSGRAKTRDEELRERWNAFYNNP